MTVAAATGISAVKTSTAGIKTAAVVAAAKTPGIWCRRVTLMTILPVMTRVPIIRVGH